MRKRGRRRERPRLIRKYARSDLDGTGALRMTDRFEIGGVRALSWDALDVTDELKRQTREANADKDVECKLCADTGFAPAPAPYGLIGCVQPCRECKKGRSTRW